MSLNTVWTVNNGPHYVQYTILRLNDHSTGLPLKEVCKSTGHQSSIHALLKCRKSKMALIEQLHSINVILGKGKFSTVLSEEVNCQMF